VGLRARQDLPVRSDLPVPTARMAHKALRVLTVRLVLMVRKVRSVVMVRPALTESMVLRALMV
jgi:hypothetical protein